MVAWSSVSLDVHSICARRIECAWCIRPFVYLAEHTAQFTSYGAPYSTLFGDSGAHRRLRADVERHLRRRPSFRRRGSARCPHCGRAQLWMWSNRLLALAPSIVLTTLIVLVPAYVAATLGVPTSRIIALAVFAGTLATAGLAYYSLRDIIRSRNPDQRSLTVEAFTQWHVASEIKGIDVAEVIWSELMRRTYGERGHMMVFYGYEVEDQTQNP